MTATTSSKIYTFRARAWRYPGKGGWHFVTLPKRMSAVIRGKAGIRKAWGAVPALVTVGKTTWKTSLFPDTKAGAYLMPLKSAVREKEHITDGKTVTCTVETRFHVVREQDL